MKILFYVAAYTTFWNCLYFKLDNGLKTHFDKRKEQEQKDRWTQTYCGHVWYISSRTPGRVSRGFWFYHDPYRKLWKQQSTKCSTFQSNISSWWFWTRDDVYMQRGWWLFAKEKLKIKIQTKPLWLSISYGKFIQTWKYKVQNNCEVSVTFHVYKHEDKKICFAQRRLEHTLSFEIDSWRQLDSAENTKINKKQQLIFNNSDGNSEEGLYFCASLLKKCWQSHIRESWEIVQGINQGGSLYTPFTGKRKREKTTSGRRERSQNPDCVVSHSMTAVRRAVVFLALCHWKDSSRTKWDVNIWLIKTWFVSQCPKGWCEVWFRELWLFLKTQFNYQKKRDLWSYRTLAFGRGGREKDGRKETWQYTGGERE